MEKRMREMGNRRFNGRLHRHICLVKVIIINLKNILENIREHCGDDRRTSERKGMNGETKEEERERGVRWVDIGGPRHPIYFSCLPAAKPALFPSVNFSIPSFGEREIYWKRFGEPHNWNAVVGMPEQPTDGMEVGRRTSPQVRKKNNLDGDVGRSASVTTGVPLTE